MFPGQHPLLQPVQEPPVEEPLIDEIQRRRDAPPTSQCCSSAPLSLDRGAAPLCPLEPVAHDSLRNSTTQLPLFYPRLAPAASARSGYPLDGADADAPVSSQNSSASSNSSLKNGCASIVSKTEAPPPAGIPPGDVPHAKHSLNKSRNDACLMRSSSGGG